MKWTDNNYPLSFSSLNPSLRKKAIDIGNSLLKYGYSSKDVKGIAVQKAREELRLSHSNYG